MTAHVAPRYIVLTPVRRGKENDFQMFIREVIIPAVEKVSPAVNGMWEVLLPPEPGDDEAAIFAFIFYGDASLDEWDLRPLLTAAYGDEDGRRRFDEFTQFLSGEQAVHEFSGALARA